MLFIHISILAIAASSAGVYWDVVTGTAAVLETGKDELPDGVDVAADGVAPGPKKKYQNKPPAKPTPPTIKSVFVFLSMRMIFYELSPSPKISLAIEVSADAPAATSAAVVAAELLVVDGFDTTMVVGACGFMTSYSTKATATPPATHRTVLVVPDTLLRLRLDPFRFLECAMLQKC
jgi:hypothetical protein